MKERIKNNINKVSELKERKLLRETLDFVFEGMIDYTDYVYEQIQKKVFAEINQNDMEKKTLCDSNEQATI